MRYPLLLVASLALLSSCKKDTSPSGNVVPPSALYFPPVGTTEWATTTPESMGWNTSALPALYDYLATQQTRAFLVLKDGKIVVEKYFGQNVLGTAPFTQNSQWYWASAGKTLTGFIVGRAQHEGFLNINSRTSQYLGAGWTSLTAAAESRITVRHQLTMTTGLDDATGNADDVSPQGLVYKADPGTRWAYHNAPYTLLQKVVGNATGQTFNNYFNARLKTPIGMDGEWRSGTSNVYWSTARSMARFGILVQAKGKWNGLDVAGDAAFLEASTNTSQDLNLSYGYLWWLNGKASAMVPQSQVVFPVSLSRNAPPDMIAAMGKDGQLLNIVPSKGLIVIRMGDNADNTLVPLTFQNELWTRLSAIIK